MTEIALQPFRVREDRLVPDRRSDHVVLDWSALVNKFDRGGRRDKYILRDLKIGEFVGIRHERGREALFKLISPQGSIKGILKKFPTFGSDLVEVYRVERTQWDAQMLEPAA